MTVAVVVTNVGNTEGDVVTLQHGLEGGSRYHVETLQRGESSQRFSVDGHSQPLILRGTHGKGAALGEIEVEVKPRLSPGEQAGRAAWDRYGKAVGWQSYDGKQLPGWDTLGDRQKAGWCAAAGVDARHNPYMRDSGGG